MFDHASCSIVAFAMMGVILLLVLELHVLWSCVPNVYVSMHGVASNSYAPRVGISPSRSRRHPGRTNHILWVPRSSYKVEFPYADCVQPPPLKWTILRSPTVRDYRSGVNTSPLLILDFSLSSLNNLSIGVVFHAQLKLSYLERADDVCVFTFTPCRLDLYVPQLCYLSIPFDSEDVDLEAKRADILRRLSDGNGYHRYRRVLLIVNSHTNTEGLIYHTVNGATDFGEVSRCHIFTNMASSNMHSVLQLVVRKRIGRFPLRANSHHGSDLLWIVHG